MPAKSKAQANLMRAAEHGANFPKAKQIRESMTKKQMHDFASGSEKGKPERVTPERAKKFQTEHSRYDNRSRNNLRRGR